jgi:hypothetical protein
MADSDSPNITMRAIDTDHLEDLEENYEAVMFPIVLSARPSDLWKQEFDILYRQTPYLLKPPVQVQGDRLQVVYLPRYAGELPGFLRFLALIVRRANEETRLTEEMHISATHIKSKEEFRRVLQHMELPQE